MSIFSPSKSIGGDYLHRWHVIPRNKYFNIYLHKFERSDDDRALHDHPWDSVSILLSGEYLEHFENETKHRKAFSIFGRRAKTAHRIEIVGSHCWTLFVTGRLKRDWGFHCPKGWVHWKSFTSFNETGDSTQIGKGCD